MVGSEELQSLECDIGVVVEKHVLDLILMEDEGLVLNVNEALSAAVDYYFVELLEAFEERHHSDEDGASVVVGFADGKDFLEDGRLGVY